FWIMAAILSKYMTVDVPVCQRHDRYFAKRMTALVVVVAVIFLVPLAVAIAGIALAETPHDQPQGIVGGFACLGVCVAIGIVVIYVIQNGTLRPKEITDGSITLVRVHDDFVRALKRSRYDDEDDDRPRRRQPHVEEVLPVEPVDKTETFRERRG